MNHPKKVMALTTSRADWGHLSSPLQFLRDDPAFDLSLVVMGAHLSPEFGFTVDFWIRYGSCIHDRFLDSQWISGFALDFCIHNGFLDSR